MSPRHSTTARSERVFARLLVLFPGEFRSRFGDDMRDVFRDQLAAARSRAGAMGVAMLWLRTIGALLRAALLERWDARSRIGAPAASTRRVGVLGHLGQDLRFALRILRKSPVFTIVAVLAISIGTGAVTTIFSAMNALVLRPLPGAAHGDRLVGLELTQRDGQRDISGSLDLYEHLRNGARTLSGLAAWGRTTFSITAAGQGAVVAGNFVSWNYFSVLGLKPALGRFFLPEEDRTPNGNPVVVVSHAFWSARLGGDSSAIGRTVSLNGHGYTLIGVAPPGFHGVITVIPVEGWVPLTMQGQLTPERDPGARWLRMFGRLSRGVDADAAQAELTTRAAAQAEAEPPASFKHEVTGVRLAPLRGIPDDARGSFLGFMALLLGAAAFVLLIASVNVASMLSARAITRRREMALRAALGAGRSRLVAQLLTEIFVLFGLGAAGGVAIAFAATRATASFPLPTDVVAAPDMSPDLRVMAFALIVSLLTGLTFGLAPALRASRDDISERLRDGSSGAGSRRGLAANVLIVGQLALSLVLLVTAGLFLRSLSAGARVDPGFDRKGVSVVSFAASVWGYDAAKARRFYHDLSERLASVPGVTDVAYASFAPLTTRSMNTSVVTDGDSLSIWFTNIDGAYFSVLRMPLVAGRALAPTDNQSAPRVAVVNQTLAKRLARDGNALGRTFRRDRELVTVVGIARDARYADLSEITPPLAYFAMEQFWDSRQTLLVRSGGSDAQLRAAIQQAVRSLDPALPTPSVATLDEAAGITLLPQRIAATVTGALGGVGLLLAALGLYGVIAYSVSRRTREIGIRVALGARRRDALGLVLREGMRLAALGVAIGLLLSAAATRLVAGLLFEVSALDALTFVGISIAFLLVAAIATYLPARRAASVDPLVALRSE